MEWWASLGWSLLIGWLFTQWMQSQNNVGARAQQQAQVLLQRAQEAAGAAQNAAASTSAGGKKGKNKKQNAGAAAKGLGGGLDGGGDPSSSSPAQPGAPGAEAGGGGGAEDLDDPSLQAALAGFLAKAEQHRADMGDGKATVEHLVLAMAEDPRFAEVLGCATGFQEDDLKSAIRKSRVLYNRGQEYEQGFEMSVLPKYSRDLTEEARQGRLDPVIGRADELRRVIDVLCRRTKNSAVLLGEPGVGKTAVVEALAQRIAAGDAPDGVAGCRVVALEMGLLMAGAAFPGEFEERLRGVLKELQDEGCRAILFIDDIHTITGPNAQQGGGVMDASVMLKPLLSRGEVRCLGATSLDRYRKFIEKDPGLERRFQQVPVEPATVAETVSILRGLRHKYEAHHGVRITDAALAAAASLSDRYLPDRHLPDKAIDLVDEAAARVKTDLALRPEALDRAHRRITQLEQERRPVARAAVLDAGAAAELEALDAELARLRAEAEEMERALELDTKDSERAQGLRDEIDRLNAEIEAAEGAGDAAKAAGLKKQKREELVRQLRGLARGAAAARRKGGVLGGGKLTRGEVSEPDIARVISKWTGIPLTKLVESEAGKLMALADELHRRIIGQHEAVAAVAEAIQRSRAGMKDPNGPIASFLFLGPTGVGKTELAKALAANLFDADDAMIRLDMSEYMEKHAVAKLIGAPPGYVGYDEGGQLTEQVRRKPYSVVLFDEVEKAHVDVFNLLLQVLDDGRVTDSQGRVVSFKNAIIILTSNLGSAEVFNHAYKKGGSGGGPEELRELVMERVRRHFQPEFLNRIDEFIVFEPLKADQIATIVRLHVRGVAARVAEKRMKLALADSAVGHLARAGFDPVYGARPVKRAVQRELETPLAKALLTGAFVEDDTILVEGAGGGCEGGGGEELTGLVFSRIPGAPDGEDGGSGSGGASGGAAAPVRVHIPGHEPRPASRGGVASAAVAASAREPAAAAAAATGASISFGSGGGKAAAGGSGGGKFDPLSGGGGKARGKKPPPAASTANGSGGDGSGEADVGSSAAPPAVNGSSGGDGGDGGSNGGGLDADVASGLLHGGQTPAFLKTPRRRDEQEDKPTCAG